MHTYPEVQQSCRTHHYLVRCSLVVLAMAEVLEVWLREGTEGGGNNEISLW